MLKVMGVAKTTLFTNHSNDLSYQHLTNHRVALKHVL